MTSVIGISNKLLLITDVFIQSNINIVYKVVIFVVVAVYYSSSNSGSIRSSSRRISGSYSSDCGGSRDSISIPLFLYNMRVGRLELLCTKTYRIYISTYI